MNITYPWGKPDPPHIPADNNPVGSYRTRFTVPAAWAGRAGLPHLRRRRVGVLPVGQRRRRSATARTAARRPSSTSRSTSSPARTCSPSRSIAGRDASYLEDQDFWRLSGIFRDVTLWSAGPLHIRDVADQRRSRRARTRTAGWRHGRRPQRDATPRSTFAVRADAAGPRRRAELATRRRRQLTAVAAAGKAARGHHAGDVAGAAQVVGRVAVRSTRCSLTLLDDRGQVVEVDPAARRLPRGRDEGRPAARQRPARSSSRASTATSTTPTRATPSPSSRCCATSG